MPLRDETRKRIEEEAARRGQDPAAALRRAEESAGGTAPQSKPSEAPAPTGPVADRLLIGFLPFIKVRELRAKWLGLTERVPDDEMMCGDFAAKHGGGTAAPAPEGE